MAEITNYDDVIDSRDVIARIEALQEMADIEDQGGECLPDDLREELANLKKLAEEASTYAPDWEYGEALIRDSYFEAYAQQLAEDCGLINPDAKWPNTCIDWEQAARELQIDYTAVDFAGVTYWIR